MNKIEIVNDVCEDTSGFFLNAKSVADSFDFDGATWMYRLSREVQAWRDNQPAPTGFYYWEFFTQDGKRLLGIRKAEGEPFTVTLSAGINAGDVTVYRKT